MPYRSVPNELNTQIATASIKDVVKFLSTVPIDSFKKVGGSVKNIHNVKPIEYMGYGIGIKIGDIIIAIFTYEKGKKVHLGYEPVVDSNYWTEVPGLSWWNRRKLNKKIKAFREKENQIQLKDFRLREIERKKREKQSKIDSEKYNLLQENRIRESFLKEVSNISELKLLK